MQRKVVKQGPNTLMVSLPIKWAERNSIRKGDLLNVLEERSYLLVSKGEAKEELKRVEVKIEEKFKAELVRSIISNLYKRGYDLIEAKVEGSKSAENVQKSVNSIMGFEITDQKEGVITIKNISKDLDNEFDSYLRKTFFMILETARMVSEDMAKGSFSRLHEVEQMNQNIKKFTDVCKRSIAKNDIYPEKNKFIYVILWCLEKTSNEYMYLYRRAEQKKIKPEHAVLSLLEDANSMVRMFYEAYYRIKKVDLGSFARIKDELYFGRSYSLIGKTKNPVIVMHIANIVRMVYNMVNPLIGVEF